MFYFRRHFRVLFDVLAAGRIGRIPVDGCPGPDKHGYDTLDFIGQTFSRYAKLSLDNEIGTFVSFQVRKIAETERTGSWEFLSFVP